MQDGPIVGGLGDQAGIDERETLHHGEIVLLPRRETVRHLQELGIAALHLLKRGMGERLGALLLDLLDDASPRLRRDARQREIGRRLGGEEAIEHREPGHQVLRRPEVGRAALRHVEQLRIVAAHGGGDLAHAGVRTQVVELAADALSRRFGDAWQRAQRAYAACSTRTTRRLPAIAFGASIRSRPCFSSARTLSVSRSIGNSNTFDCERTVTVIVSTVASTPISPDFASATGISTT